jgi:hypothetical protein
VVLVLAAVEGASAWLDAQDLNELSLTAIYLRGILSRAEELLRPVSPVAYLADLARNVAGGPRRLASGR